MTPSDDTVNPRLRRKLTTVLAVVGSAAYVWCGVYHIPGDRHAPRWPYRPWQVHDYAIDFVWMAGYALAVVLATKANLYRAGQFIGLIAFLLVSRGVFASGMGLLFLLELPAILALLFLAVIGFLQPPDRKPVPLPTRGKSPPPSQAGQRAPLRSR